MAGLISVLRGWVNYLRWGNSSGKVSQGARDIQERLALFEGQTHSQSGRSGGDLASPATHLRPLTRVKLATLLAVGGILLAGLSAGVFSASGRFMPMAAALPSPTATPGKGNTQALCDKFVSHLAQDLGKNGSDVKAAIAQAVSQTIDDAVASGSLPKAQADPLKKKLASGPLCAGSLFSSEGLNGHAGTPESDDTGETTGPSGTGAHQAESDD